MDVVRAVHREIWVVTHPVVCRGCDRESLVGADEHAWARPERRPHGITKSLAEQVVTTRCSSHRDDIAVDELVPTLDVILETQVLGEGDATAVRVSNHDAR